MNKYYDRRHGRKSKCEEKGQPITTWRRYVGEKKNLHTHIYTTIGGPSSKFDEFLAARSQFVIDHGVDFSSPTSCQSATFVRPLFAFYCTLFFTKKIIHNAAFRHRRSNVYAARLVDLRNR